MSSLQRSEDLRSLVPRLQGMGVVVTLFFIALLGRLCQLQILEGEHYTRRAERNFIDEVIVEAPRGRIFASGGEVLATNRPAYTLYVTPIPRVTVESDDPKAPAVGSVQDSVDDLVQHLTIHDPTAPDPLELTLGRHLDKRTKVVEITGGVRTKVEVTYRDASESQQVAGGDDASRPLAVAGKSYLVWIEGGEGGTIRATAVDGGDVGDAERELLVEDHEGELGRMPGMAQVIVGRPWTQGQAVALADDERREVAAAMGPGTTVDGISITWTGTEAGVASFAVDMQVVRGDGADQMKTSSHAVVRLDVGHARPVEVTAHAQISGQRSGATVEGTMEAHTVNTYPEGP